MKTIFSIMKKKREGTKVNIPKPGLTKKSILSLLGLTKKLPLEKKFSLSTDMRELLCIFRLPNAKIYLVKDMQKVQFKQYNEGEFYYSPTV